MRSRTAYAVSIRDFIADFSLVLIALIAVMTLLPISQGYAFPAPFPTELNGLNSIGVLPAVTGCAGQWSALTTLTGTSPAYLAASLGPNLSDIPVLGSGFSAMLALAIALATAVNLAVFRHVSSIIAVTRR